MESSTKNISKEEIAKELINLHKSEVNTIINVAAGTSTFAGAGLAQFPCADAVPITAAQVAMIIKIALVFKTEITTAVAKSFIGSYATMLVGRHLATSVIGIFPGFGNSVKAITAGALTKFIGSCAVDHFAEMYAETLYNESLNANKIGEEYSKKYIDLAGAFDKAFNDHKIAVLEYQATLQKAKQLFEKSKSEIDEKSRENWEKEYDEIEAVFVRELKDDTFGNESEAFKKAEALYQKTVEYGKQPHE